MSECKHCGKKIQGRASNATTCWNCYTNYPKIHNAVREVTRAAVRRGELAEPTSLICSDCGKPAECYDHRDYNQPLLVEAVCKPCNSSRGAGIPQKHAIKLVKENSEVFA